MPGSPPMRIVEPGTTPPPVTRSSSEMPLENRGASWVEPFNVSSLTMRPLLCRVTPDTGGGPASVSSTRVFQPSQAAHLPAQRVAVAPHAWQTERYFESLAMNH